MRVGPDANDSESKALTGWYRTGKVVAADDIDIQASLTLQKGLIFWTSVHMWPQLASKGKDAARFLQLGFMAPSMTMAAETWMRMKQKMYKYQRECPHKMCHPKISVSDRIIIQKDSHTNGGKALQ